MASYGTMKNDGAKWKGNNGSGSEEGKRKKRVLIVGAGAAGMSCAHHLSHHPSQFSITLIDASAQCGGQAFSIPIEKQIYGAEWMNQGVQGGSLIFHHTMTMFKNMGYQANPVDLQVSFGKGENFWTNIFPTKLLERHQSEIKRFVRVMKLVRWFEAFFALIPIRYLMMLFFFSSEFTNYIVLPMVALFLGTGNATPDVPSIILERLCTSPTYGMWYPLDKQSVAGTNAQYNSNLPPMVVFPRLSSFYEDWRKSLVKRGVAVRLSTELTQVVKRDKTGVVVRTIKRSAMQDSHNPNSAWVPNDRDHNADEGAAEVQEHYDELVLCVLADTAKRVLEPTSSFFERRILGSAKFADDVTVTHTDSDYMKKHYTNFYDRSEAVSSLSGVDLSARLERAQKNAGEVPNARSVTEVTSAGSNNLQNDGGGGFKPMYLIKTYPKDRRKLEMCFDCTNYQAQFPPVVPFERHIFQTIFLNKKMDQEHWDIDEIDPEKVIRKDWWHQLMHSYTHYLFVVPWIWLLNGPLSRSRRTRFAAAWTIVNAHEVAVLSGTAAAVDLGADYPRDLKCDGWALLCFRLYYLLCYGKWYSKKHVEDVGDEEGKSWASGLYGSVYKGPGVSKREREMWRVENGVIE